LSFDSYTAKAVAMVQRRHCIWGFITCLNHSFILSFITAPPSLHGNSKQLCNHCLWANRQVRSPFQLNLYYLRLVLVHLILQNVYSFIPQACRSYTTCWNKVTKGKKYMTGCRKPYVCGPLEFFELINVPQSFLFCGTIAHQEFLPRAYTKPCSLYPSLIFW